MPDELINTESETFESEDTATPETTAPAAPTVATFTQEQVNEIVRARVAEEKRRQSKKRSPDPKPAQTELPSDISDLLAKVITPLTERINTIAETLSSQQAREADASFNSAFAASGIPEGVKDLVHAAFKHESPADAAAWVASQASKFGGQAMQLPGKEKPTPGASPSPAHRDIESIKLESLTAEDVARLQSEGRLLPTLEKFRKAGSNGRPMPFGKRAIK